MSANIYGSKDCYFRPLKGVELPTSYPVKIEFIMLSKTTYKRGFKYVH